MEENCQAPVRRENERRGKGEKKNLGSRIKCIYIPCLMCLTAQYSRPAPAVCEAGKPAHLARRLCARDDHSSLQGLW